MQRRRKLYKTKDKLTFNLHSIPNLLLINHKKKNSNKNEDKEVKSNVLYSIPSVVVLVFLFGLISLLHNVIYSNSCYAVTTASLSLSNPNMVSEAVVPGEIAIASTNVAVTIDNAESYSLILKVDNTNITNGSTTITPGNPDSSASSNVWGYKWDNASTYTTPTTTGTILTSSTNPTSGTALSGGSVSFTKVLTFGAKFGSNANAGTYHGSGTISLVATPRATVYTLTLNANNGTGGDTTKTCSTYTSSCTISLSGTSTPTRTGYDFLGWGDSNNATSASYTTASTITMNGNKTIWAVWKSNSYTYTVKYQWGNGIEEAGKVSTPQNHVALPEDQSITTTDLSYTFSLNYSVSVERPPMGCCALTAWQDELGNIYKKTDVDQTITLTPEKPSIVLTTYTASCKCS